MNAEEGPADAEHFAQDATSNNVEDWERRGILIAPLALCVRAASLGKPPGIRRHTPTHGRAINRVLVFV